MIAGTRLLTLTGAGGSGKIRLGLQLAAEMLEDSPDGVWVVELASLSDAALVPNVVASALGVREAPGRPLSEILAESLAPKKLLLVLDNCEQVVGACADLAAALMRSCPGLTLVATTREALGAPGEVVWPVPSLSTPDPDRLPPSGGRIAALGQYEAVRLFIDRACLTKPGFAVTNENAPAVAQICHRLDGIPLAIELAAGRVKVLMPEQIAARLDDRFRLLTGGSRTVLPRHQTLRAAIDWSYDLLAEPERTLLRRLAVFAGGWTLEAAETVCAGEGVESREVLELQTHLVDKSLVIVEQGVGGEARYRLLGTIRQYARDRLFEAGEAGRLRDVHRDWFLELAERASRELRGPDQAQWLERLEQEHDNLRAALEWSQAGEGGAEKGLELAAALHRFWTIRGHLTEGRQWLESSLSATRDLTSPGAAAARARGLRGGGLLAWAQNDVPRARALLEESLALSRGLGDKRALARTLNTFGYVALDGADEQARPYFEEALSLAREIGEMELVGFALNNLGEMARARGDYQQARAFYQEALATYGDVLNTGQEAALGNLGLVAFRQEDYSTAQSFFAESLAVAWRLGDKSGITSGPRWTKLRSRPRGTKGAA